MGFYRRFILDAFRRYYPKKTAALRNPIQESVSQNTFSIKSSNSRISQFYHQPILRNSVFQNVLRNNQRNSPFLEGAKRFYHHERSKAHQPHPFIVRVQKFANENPRISKSIILLGSGLIITATLGSTETVPYTNRSHLVLLSSSFEKELGESEFKKITEEYKGKILPPPHSDSIRVLKIANEIIDVVKSKTQHLKGFEWEIIVVDDPTVNAYCLPGGKIVVFTGLLQHFVEDAEIATILGHEVGHAVARHSAEQIYQIVWLKILQLIFYQYYTPDVVNIMSEFLLRLPYSRRCEMEADYIGLILIASAGYDPRVAPQVYEKLSKVGGGIPLQDYLATHPSGKKRSELLSQPKVMEEALSIYREVAHDAIYSVV